MYRKPFSIFPFAKNICQSEMRWTWCLFVVICLTFEAATIVSSQIVNLGTQLPGTYDYINIYEFLGFPADSSVNFICPKELVAANAENQKFFNLTIRNGTAGTSGFECYIKGDETVQAAFERVIPNETANHAPHLSGPATVFDLETHYPTFFGNFSDHPLVCSFLNVTIQPISLTVRDIGYIQTILSYYKDAPKPLGSDFDKLSWRHFAKVQSSYIVGMTISPDTIGCSFVKKSDRDTLLALKQEILNPTPNQTISNGPSENHTDTRSACFPANAKVMLQSGEYKTVEQLQVGESVLDSAGSYSPVILFTHADSDVWSEFIHIHGENSEVILSPGHFLYANSRAIAAEDVRPKNVLTRVSKHANMINSSIVVTVERKTLRGLYNPQTASGNIIIYWGAKDGVLATTYTRAVSPHFAHSLLWPLRVLFSKTGVTLPWLSRPFKYGVDTWPFLS